MKAIKSIILTILLGKSYLKEIPNIEEMGVMINS